MSKAKLKRAAAEAAANLVRDGMRVGLGSGSTSREFVKILGRRIENGLKVTGVASSAATADLARQVGIPLAEHDTLLDLAVDGADAIARDSLTAIKGLGGALVRERLIAESAFEFIIVVDEGKIFDNLDGSRPAVPVPVEVLPFGWKLTRDRLAAYGRPSIRLDSNGSPYRTDNGNFILDLYECDYSSTDRLAAEIKSLSGVVDHGLFLRLVTSVMIGTSTGIVQLDAGERAPA